MGWNVNESERKVVRQGVTGPGEGGEGCSYPWQRGERMMCRDGQRVGRKRCRGVQRAGKHRTGRRGG